MGHRIPANEKLFPFATKQERKQSPPKNHHLMPAVATPPPTQQHLSTCKNEMPVTGGQTDQGVAGPSLYPINTGFLTGIPKIR